MAPKDERLDVHLVANAHIDPVWLWDWREGMHEALRTFASALARLDETPDLVFTATSASLHQWVEITDPELFSRIRARVEEGRWVLTGGQWVEPDCHLPSGESVCRQLLYGQRYFHRAFGRIATVGYNIDSFGHAGSLPQLLKAGGLDAYVFMRPGQHEMNLPAPVFRWVGVDGTSLPAFRLPFGYDTSTAMEEDAIPEWAAILQRTSEESGSPMMLFFGVGDHGGGPTVRAIAKCREAIDDSGDTVGFSSPDRYFAQVDADELPSAAGELVHHAPGCYSALSSVKRANARAPAALTSAEKLAELARAGTGRDVDVSASLRDGWLRVLFNQFHDSLGGTCTAEAHAELDHFWAEALGVADTVTAVATQSLAQLVDTSSPPGALRSSPAVGSPVPVVLFNPLSWRRSVAIRLPQSFVAGADTTGSAAPVQTVPSGQITSDPSHTLLLADLPPLGFRTYWLRRRGPSPAETAGAATVTETGAGEATLSNGVIEATVDPANGLVDLRDVSNGHRYLRDPVLPVVLVDPSDTWSHGVRRYDGAEEPWAVESVEITERGPVRATAVVNYRYRESRLRQEVSTYLGCAFVEVRHRIDWRQGGSLVKLVVPLDLGSTESGRGPSVTAGAPYGHAERAADGAETVMQHWVSVMSPEIGAGITVTSDYKYAYDLESTRLRLTALRSPRYADHGGGWADAEGVDFPVTDQGAQRYSFRLHLHRGTWADASAPRLAEEHLTAASLVLDTRHPGRLGTAGSYLRVEPDTVTVPAVKRAEEGGGTVLRVWESIGRATDARIELPFLGRRWEGALRPHQVLTLLVADDPNQEIREIALHELTL